MSGTTSVCQPGSARRCVCRACKPYGKHKKKSKFKTKFQCVCKIQGGRDSSLESLSSSSDLYKEIFETKLINHCKCVGCKPVFTYKRKRLCHCENSKHKIKVNLKSFEKHYKRKHRYSRGTVIDIANKQLSDEILNDPNKRRIDDIYDDEFLIVTKKSSSFLLDKDIITESNNYQDGKPILKKISNKNEENSKETVIPLKKSDSGLTFSREKLVVEYNLEKENAIFYKSGYYFLGFNKFELFKKRDNNNKREETDKKNKYDKNMSHVKKKDFLVTVPIENADNDSEIETSVTKYTEEDSARVLRERRDSNVMYYSKYISEHDTKRITYGLHRLLHNYAMFRCEDRAITEGILSESFIEKLSEGFDLFLQNAYFYDPYYQPISFKRRYGYIEIHVKVGVEDVFAENYRMFKKVFLVIFQRSSVKYILTKYNKPGKMIEKNYQIAVNEKQCRDIWCRVDLITAIVHRKHRRIRHRVIETLYDIITSDDKGFFKLVEPLDDLWICIDFDTASQKWSKTERSQFIKQMRRESNPYHKENIKKVASIETQLEKERKARKRKYKPSSSNAE